MPLALRHALILSAAALVTALPALDAHAWSLSLAPARRQVFLHVGNGVLNGNSGTVNIVEVKIEDPSLVGNGVPLPMRSNSTQSLSLYGDNYATCPEPANQVMIGASYRRNNNGAPATAILSVTAPAVLTNASGDTIPFSEISWTVSAAGSPNPNVIRAGTFTTGTQTLATVPANTYIENCHSFRYANSAIRAAGTYNGRVTYTLSNP